MPRAQSTSNRPRACRLLLVLGALLAVTGCDDNEPKWWCQTEAGAAKDRKGLQKCYRLPEYCEGGCERTHSAQCFDIGLAIQGPYGGPPDRACYADGETCAQARDDRDRRKHDVTSGCRGMSE